MRKALDEGSVLRAPCDACSNGSSPWQVTPGSARGARAHDLVRADVLRFHGRRHTAESGSVVRSARYGCFRPGRHLLRRRRGGVSGPLPYLGPPSPRADLSRWKPSCCCACMSVQGLGKQGCGPGAGAIPGRTWSHGCRAHRCDRLSNGRSWAGSRRAGCTGLAVRLWWHAPGAGTATCARVDGPVREGVGAVAAAARENGDNRPGAARSARGSTGQCARTAGGLQVPDDHTTAGTYLLAWPVGGALDFVFPRKHEQADPGTLASVGRRQRAHAPVGTAACRRPVLLLSRPGVRGHPRHGPLPGARLRGLVLGGRLVRPCGCRGPRRDPDDRCACTPLFRQPCRLWWGCR